MSPIEVSMSNTPVDLHVMPEGGWTKKNIKAYRNEWWRQYFEVPHKEVEDTTGRLRKGQRIRWSHSDAGKGDMEVISLCAPTGLYRRPLRDGDEGWRVEHAAICGGGTPCEKDEPGAVYQPENLMVFFRYLATDEATTGQAIHMTVVADKVRNGRAQTRPRTE